MGWENITYKCGHEGREQMYGKMKDREKKVKWISDNKICPNCEIIEINTKAEKSNLIGSPKQVIWAEDIKTQMLNEINKMLNIVPLLPDNPNYNKYVSGISILNEMNTEIMNATSATWFIDNRNDYPRSELSRRLNLVFSI